VFRGDRHRREFVAFWLDADNHVVAGMNVNVWDVLDEIKNLIHSKAKVNLNALIDPETPLSEVVS
jgi:3-phenylpropionate/trans-cinnamate dioxygenase ferredoxin reductase subunit